jgi:hypothetical protein
VWGCLSFGGVLVIVVIIAVLLGYDASGQGTAVVVIVSLILGGVIFFVGGPAIERRFALRRSARLFSINDWVAKRGWSLGVLSGGLTLPARGIPFTLGGEHVVLSSAGGQHRGRDAMVVYYQVASSERPGALTYDFTIVAVGADADFPITVAEPQRGVSLMKSLVGFQDIDVESAEFNRRWRVVGKDVRGSHAIFSPRVIERLNADDAGQSPVTWDSNAIMVIRDGFSDDWAAIDADLDLLADLSELVPGYMTRAGASTAGLARSSTARLGTVKMPRIRNEPVTIALYLMAMVPLAMAKGQNRAGHLGAAAVLLAIGLAVFGIASWRTWRHKARRRREWADRVNTQR